jgi:pimeloyl-ACP methyl ester carboxylesterase
MAAFRIAEQAYEVFGAGETPVLAFHGFGQGPEAFAAWAGQRPGLRVYAFRLHGHGWEGTPDARAWAEAMAVWMGEEGIRKCAVVAFSMGCRPAWQLLRWVPERISSLAALAPDGLHPHPLYWLATRTWIGKRLFPATLRALAVLLPKLLQCRCLPKRLGLPLWRVLQDDEARARLAACWRHYRDWGLAPRELARLMRLHGIAGVAILARRDPIVPAWGAKAWQRCLPELRVEVLEGGHFGLLRRGLSQLPVAGTMQL